MHKSKDIEKMITKNMKSGYAGYDLMRAKAEAAFGYPARPIVSNGGDDENPNYKRPYKKGGHVTKEMKSKSQKDCGCQKNK
jgi:hypothetical protein